MPIPQLSEPTWKIRDIQDQKSKQQPKKKKSTKKKGGRLKLLLKILLIGFGAGVLVFIGAFAWASKDLPDPNKILERNIAQSTKIYDRTGEHLLYDIHGDEKRTLVKLEDIPEHVRWATVVIEDQDFYSHHGFDVRGIIRAIWINVTHADLKGQGGSTITQQFIKNSILTPEKTYTRKFKELVLAYQMERKFTKDEILQLYLNEIPYGSTAYGIESAADTYFAKSARDLTYAQGALLAALPQAPTYYSPHGSHVDELIGRQQYILDLMAKQEYITAEEAAVAKEEELVFSEKVENITAPHFVFYVREHLAEKYGERFTEQGGLKVTTTLDMPKQEAAEAAIAGQAEKNLQYNASNAALVSIDTKTGQVLAMIGSQDYFDESIDGQVNNAIRKHQPGSSFKPIVYVTAFDRGYTPSTMVFDLKTQFGPKYNPNNYDGGQQGPVKMQQALASSLNISAVKTGYLAGLGNVIDTAKSLGYTTLEGADERCGLALSLGCGEVTLLEHTSAFAALAREGMRRPTTPILKIEDSAGEIVEEFEEKEGDRVFDQGAVQKLNSVLSNASLRTFARNYLSLPDRTVASKTGTTNDFRDAWTMGYTPTIAAGVWVGNNDNSEMSYGGAGAVVAAPIWHEYMKNVLTGSPVEEFNRPKPDYPDKPILRGEIDTVTERTVDKVTGKVIPEECVGDYPAEFKEIRDFKETHTILYYIFKEEPRGDYPQKPQNDPQFSAWEASVRYWAENNDYTYDAPEHEDCNLRKQGNDPTATIDKPKANATLNEENFVIKTTLEAGQGRKLARAEYRIDSTLVDTVTSSPWQTSYSPANLTNGGHTLTVTAYDDIENYGSDSVNFTYDSEQPTTLRFTQPSSPQTLTKDDFPFSVTVYAYNPAGVESVSLYYQDAERLSSSPQLIGRESSPNSNTAAFVWEESPWYGKYKLYFKVLTKKGETDQSDSLNITVGPAEEDE